MASATVSVGENIAATLDGSKLTLVIDLDKRLRRSASGKTTLVATTGGNRTQIQGVNIGINLYTK